MGKKTLVIFIDTLMEPLIESVMVVVNISDLIRFEQFGATLGAIVSFEYLSIDCYWLFKEHPSAFRLAVRFHVWLFFFQITTKKIDHFKKELYFKKRCLTNIFF